MTTIDMVFYRDSTGNWCPYQRRRYFEKIQTMTFRKLKTEIKQLKKLLSTNGTKNEYIDRTNKMQASYKLSAILRHLDRVNGSKPRKKEK
jgi:hypothetical protein